MRATQSIIDLSALTHNLAQIKVFAPNRKVLAVVKADAYGHGMVEAAKALAAADALAVACLDEALILRKGGITAPIVLLEGCYDANELDAVVEHKLQIVVHHFYQLEALEQASLDQPISVWLKYDTGMNRLGFAKADVNEAYQRLARLNSVRELILMTHLSNADDISDPKTGHQLKLFKQAFGHRQEQKSVANSAAILAWPESHFDWVRPGILLYGVSPFGGKIGTQHGLKPAMSLTSAIISVKCVSKGEGVGYGEHWQAPSKTRIAIVAMGYGDGYPRHANNGTPVYVNGRIAHLVGRVSMDMLAIDLGPDATDQIGDTVEFWGNHLAIEKVAEHCNTIPYTLLCGLAPRVTRSWQE